MPTTSLAQLLEATDTTMNVLFSFSLASPVGTENPAEMLNVACSGRRGVTVGNTHSASFVRNGPRELPSREEVLANS